MSQQSKPDDNEKPGAPQPPKRLAKWVAGVTGVMTASATIYGLFADKKVAVLAFIGMVFAIVLLVVVERAAKQIETAKARFYEIVVRILIVFVLLYFMAVAVAIWPALVKWLTTSPPAPVPQVTSALSEDVLTVVEDVLFEYPLLRDEAAKAAAQQAAPVTDARFDWNSGKREGDNAVAVRVRAWEVLVRYNDLLAGLVSGRPAEDLRPEIDGLRGAMSQVQNLAGTLADAAPYLNVVKVLIIEAKKQADCAAAVQSLIGASPAILSFVALLKQDALDFYALRIVLRDREYGALTDRLTDARIELQELLMADGVVTKTNGEWVSGPANLEGVVIKANQALEGVFEFKDRGVGEIAGSGGTASVANHVSAAATAITETMLQLADKMRGLDARTLAAKKVLECYDDLLDALKLSIEGLHADALRGEARPLDADGLKRCVLAVRIAMKQYQEAK